VIVFQTEKKLAERFSSTAAQKQHWERLEFCLEA